MLTRPAVLAPDPISSASLPTGRFSTGRILGIIGLLGLVGILATATILALIERGRLREAARQDAQSAAFFLADHAGRLLEVSDVALRGAMLEIENRDWDAISQSKDIQQRLRATSQTLPYVEDVWLNDANGTLRLTSFAFPTPPSNASDRDIFVAARQPSDKLLVGDRIVGKVTKRATFLLGRRLEAQDGTFRGMASVTADLAYFSDYWRRLRLAYEPRVTLFRADRPVVLTQHPPLPEGDASAPLPAAIVGAIRASPIAGTLPSSTGEREIGAYRQVENAPLYVGVSFSRAAIRQAWRNWAWTYLPFAAAALLALSGLTLLGFRQARREAAAKAQIERARAELSAANADLEGRVAERTADLRESNNEIQRFAYIVSHDLRAPLVNIMGFTSEIEALRDDVLARLRTLRAQAPSSEPQQDEALGTDFGEAIGFIKTSTIKMDRLINAILKLSREGRREFRPEPVDMDEMIRSIAASLAHQAEAAGATISADSLPPITSDRFALEQVFSNLVDNALKYLRADEPGRIEVKGRADGASVVYEVRDNGRGIDEHDRERVFDLFRRAGKQDRPGEGIGLAHVRALVRRLGGSIGLESIPGSGSTFTVTLPRSWIDEPQREAA